MPLSKIALFIRSRLKVLARTGSSVVYYMLTDPSTVLKGRTLYIDGKAYEDDRNPQQTDDNLRREARIYEALASHERITTCLGLEVNEQTRLAWALRLERSEIGCVREYILDNGGQPPNMHSRLRMALDFAEGVQYLHTRGVLWGDLSARNALLFGDDLRVKLCDFAGSCLTGVYDRLQYSYETRYLPPMRDADLREVGPMELELFALGSAIYEMTECTLPYGTVEDIEVDRSRGRLEWPKLSDDNPAADIIWGCWKFQYGSAQAIIEGLQNLLPLAQS